MYSAQTKSWHWPHPWESQWQSPHSWEPRWQWPHHSWWDWGYNWGPAAAAWGPADQVVEFFRDYQDWQPHKAQDEDANGKGTYPGPPGLGKAQGADARGKKGAKRKAQDEDANGKGLYPGQYGQGKAQGADARGKKGAKRKAQDEDANGKGSYPGKAQGADARGKKGTKRKAQDEDANGKGLYPSPHGQGKAQGADAKGKRKGKEELSPDEQKAKDKERKKKRAEKRKYTERENTLWDGDYRRPWYHRRGKVQPKDCRRMAEQNIAPVKTLQGIWLHQAQDGQGGQMAYSSACQGQPGLPQTASSCISPARREDCGRHTQPCRPIKIDGRTVMATWPEVEGSPP